MALYRVTALAVATFERLIEAENAEAARKEVGGICWHNEIGQDSPMQLKNVKIRKEKEPT